MKCQMKNTVHAFQIPRVTKLFQKKIGLVMYWNFSKKYYTEMISKSNNVPLKLLHKLLTSHLPDTPQSAYSIV